MTDLVFGPDPVPEVEADSTCVIYERGTGRIRHTHRVVTLRGGQRRDEEELVREAREQFRLAGGEGGEELNDLVVDSGALDMPGIVSVEPTTGELMSRPHTEPLLDRLPPG